LMSFATSGGVRRAIVCPLPIPRILYTTKEISVKAP
jgi:hypothetical protein